MKWARLLSLSVVFAGPWVCAQKLESDARAEQIIEQLDMHVLARESGYTGVIGRADSPVASYNGRALAAQSQNYYLLTSTRPIDYLHRVDATDTRVLIEGGPVDVYVFCSGERPQKQTLGRDYAADERGVVSVAPGCWKALQLRPGATYALMSNVVSPEWTSDRVHVGQGQEWVNGFAGKAPWATPEFLRGLIGPNWNAMPGLR